MPPGLQMGLRVAELFAGVGGFRLGLQAAGHEVVWWNQWEPSTKTVQHAFTCYVRNFHDGQEVDPLHNIDIGRIPSNRIPEHDLLVGGFPCQDYSVAAPLRHSKGLRGKKGVLWWQLNRILEDRRPPYVLLENVDRLLTSPKVQRGRDFGVLLSCMAQLGYVVEWRVINAADYGQPQRRRRVFIFAAHRTTPTGARMGRLPMRPDYLTRTGFFPGEFKVVQEPGAPKVRGEEDFVQVPLNPKDTSDHFSFDFKNAGVMVDGRIWTQRVDARRERARPRLRSCIEKGAPAEFYVPLNLIASWKKAKDAKEILKTSRRGGYSYLYKEGKIAFPDSLTDPARTLLTSEGSLNPSRSNHILRDPWSGRLRILTPRECERLMGFPPDWTKGIPTRWRYFTMGNAVIVGIVERLGHRIEAFLHKGDNVRREQVLLAR